MDLGIADKTALVLGAGGGLGGAIARELAAEGASVVVADRDADATARTVAAIESAGGTAWAAVWDLADIEAIDREVSLIEERTGCVDILVNNTGGPPPSPVARQAIGSWETHFRSMVLSAIALTDRVLTGQRERGWGRIITSASSGVISPIPDLGMSNALRTGLLGWSKTLAGEVGKYGVTSNVVLPGRIATGRIQFVDEAEAKYQNRPADDVTEESLAVIPAGRYGDPQEYGQAVAFLASSAASYINGCVIRVDGGYISSI